jgi:hypothetical protein
MNEIYVEDYCNLGVTRPQRVGDGPGFPLYLFFALTSDKKDVAAIPNAPP